MLVRSLSESAEKALAFAVSMLPSHLEIVEESKPEPKKEMTVSELQRELNEHFDAQLVVDGKLGPKTSAAIHRAEEFLKLPVDGVPDLGLYEALEILQGLVFDFTPKALVIDSPNYEDTKDEYLQLWNTLEINPNKVSVVQSVCARILAHQKRYEGVTKLTGVPWQVIAVIHNLECSGRFDRHLHEGSPLTGRTINVPKGRPTKGTPPFTWEDSAVDALGYDGGTGIKDWSIARTLHFLTKYNGWGYTKKGINSPYIFSMTNHYTKGKYTRDSYYDPEAVSQQVGAAAILKMLKYS